MVAEIVQTHPVEPGFTKRYVDSSRLRWDIEPGACHWAYRRPDPLTHPTPLFLQSLQRLRWLVARKDEVTGRFLLERCEAMEKFYLCKMCVIIFSALLATLT